MKIKYSEEIYFEIQNEILVYYQKKPLDKKISNKTLTCYGIPYEIPDEILNKIQNFYDFIPIESIPLKEFMLKIKLIDDQAIFEKNFNKILLGIFD